MENQLQFLTLAKDAIRDAYSDDLTIVRAFDTFYIPSGQTQTIQSFFITGRALLYSQGIVNSSARIKIFNDEGSEIYSVDLGGNKINTDLSVNIIAKCSLVEFKKVGKYSIEVNIKIEEKEFEKVGNPIYFWVKDENK